jgi:sulfonate transport system substrate-binding protein
MTTPIASAPNWSRRRFVQAAGAGLPALALAACGASTTSSTAKVAKSAGLSGATITVGQEGSDTQAGFVASGVFASAPYKIRYATFASPTDILTALATGAVDVANNVAQWTATQAAVGATPVWTAATAPYKNILVSAPGNPEHYARFVVAASRQSGITSIKQAKHKRWGIIPGSSLELFAYVVLHKLGWSIKDIDVVSLDATNQVLAVQTGQVDVLFNVMDNLVTALAQGAKVIGTAYDYGLTIYTGFLANEKALNNPAKGKALEDFTKRMVEYQNWYNTHPGPAQSSDMKYEDLTAAEAKSVWEYARVIPEAPSAAIATYSQSLVDFAYQTGLITKHVDAAGLLDDRYASVINATVKSTNLLANLTASYQ